MPTPTDLIGGGVPPLVAEMMGNQPVTVTCTGTAQGTAAAIRGKAAELVAAASNTGAVLSSSAKVGSPYYLFTSSSTTAVVYIPTGAYLNGVQNDSLTIAQNKAAIMWEYKKDNWASIIAA